MGTVTATRSSSMRDEASFEEFVVARSAALWRSAFLLTGDAQKAEDLVQVALVKTWRHWGDIDRVEAVEAYARKAMATTYTDWWRRRWKAETPTENPPEQLLADESVNWAARHDVLLALADLPRGQRAVVVLRYFDDLTERETAEVLGISVGTVKSQAARALASLRAHPEFTGIDVPKDQP